jgi:deoxyribodipyrimidine photo-lyase
MSPSIHVMWFDQDLRLSDNPALSAALHLKHILPIFILDEQQPHAHALGSASKWWLHHSLVQLNNQLHGQLNFYRGDAHTVITQLTQRFNISSISWNRRYEPWRITRDAKIKHALTEQNITVTSFNGSLINEPWHVLKKDRTPYKIFTPYYQQCKKINPTPHISPSPVLANTMHCDELASSLKDLSLLPVHSWGEKLDNLWQPGETGAHAALHHFLERGLPHYKKGRDFPARSSTSILSPHLHFGEISPRQIIHLLASMSDDHNTEHFIRELYWREFSYYLLFHWPDIPHNNLKTSFDLFPWRYDPTSLALWQQGLTGYPLVDAGMRELLQTGFMHNRVRMITASFLIKNLLIDWRLGAQWFWECLVDADLASNSASWQWVAGCGTDASPYFRIFNPITQGEKFDPQGTYTKRYVPELKALPDNYLYRPWDAPPDILNNANIILGTTYPRPIVDIKTSRDRALNAYQQTKS